LSELLTGERGSLRYASAERSRAASTVLFALLQAAADPRADEPGAQHDALIAALRPGAQRADAGS